MIGEMVTGLDGTNDVSVSEHVAERPRYVMSDPVEQTEQMELEAEFQRLCGAEQTPSLEVCHRTSRFIKEITVKVGVEVSRGLRIGDAQRNVIDEVGQDSTHLALESLEGLVKYCTEYEVLKRWIQILMRSLECQTRDQVVERIGDMLVIDTQLQEIAREYECPVTETLTVVMSKLQLLNELQSEIVVLQEQARQQSIADARIKELEERCRRQEQELLEMKTNKTSAGEVNVPGEPDEVGRLRRAQGLLNGLRRNPIQVRPYESLQNGGDERAERPEWRPLPWMPSTSSPGCRPSLTGVFPNSEIEGGNGRSVRQGGAVGMTESESMAQYLKYAALPEVVPYSGQEKSYTFSKFLEAFMLKYPRNNWTESERCALFRSKLTGKAKSQLETLPGWERNGAFEVLVEAMQRECRAENRTNKIVALGELKRLKKREAQTVSEFCIELERLTRVAYPELNEAALATERAHLLYEQLAHWRDSYYLLEALESEQGAYDKLKETAKRIERRDLTVRNSQRAVDDRSRVMPGRAKEPRGFTKPSGHESSKKAVICYNCHKEGHYARDCGSAEGKGKSFPKKAVTSLSARLRDSGCHAVGTQVRSERKDCDAVAGTLFGKKMLTEVDILGVTCQALLDTGSEISILPGNVLLQARRRGCDIDKDVKEEAIDKSKQVCDASGNIMQFVTVVEVPLRELSCHHDVIAKMYVSNVEDSVVILGTNLLERLGYQLVKVEEPCQWVDQDKLECVAGCISSGSAQVAKVVKRTYVAPGATEWVCLSGCDPGVDSLLTSSINAVQSGVCRASVKGTVEVPIVNRSEEPFVLRAGEAVGEWGKESVDWAQAKVKDISADVLAKPSEKLSEAERISKLKAALTDNCHENQLHHRLWEMVYANNDVFAVNDYELTQTSLVAHEIETDDTRPIKQRTRPVPLGARSELKEILSGLLERGIISKSHSPWASPIVLVRKKDGSIRLCVDYRELNKHTTVDAYPLPTSDAILQSLQGKAIFTSLDLCSGYWQIPLSEDAKAKSAFTTAEGLFEFNVLPFGLSTSPAQFQRLMDRVLGDLKDKEVFVYIDDILIATESEQRHLEVIQEVFQALREANLKLKPQKCVFMQSEIAFLGHRVNVHGVHVDPDKINKIKEYPRPENVKQLRTFLGLCGYYRKFILNFSRIARALFELTSQVTWKWQEEQEKAFQRLKEVLTTPPVLAQPDVERARTGEKPFVVYTDASQQGIGAVLCQEGEDGLLHPVYFASKTLTRAERNYHVTDTEALALVFALRKFHFFLYGMEVVVRTDHLPLTALFKRTNISGRVLRWALEIQQYKVKVEYVKGQANAVADALSRGLPCVTPCDDNGDSDEKRVVCMVEKKESEWLKELRKDPPYRDVVESLERKEEDSEVCLPRLGKRLKVLDFVLDEGNLKLIREDGSFATVVPKSCRREVFEEAHRGSMAGHFNARKILRMLKAKVFWEGMESDIPRWAKECQECFLTNPRPKMVPRLKPFVASKPFEVICTDVLEMGLSMSGMRYVLVIVDHFSKWLGAYAMADKRADTVAHHIFQRWICEGGRWPRQLHSDQGSEFVNSVVQELARVAEVAVTTTKGYNSRENGLAERAIGTVQRMLKKKVEFADSWDVILPNVVYAYNITPHEATGESPFFLLHGFDPHVPSRVIPESEVTSYQVDLDDYKTELLRGMQLIREQVKERADEYREKMKSWYDTHKAVGSNRSPKVGSRVFMRLPAEKSRSRHPKLTVEWDGPFRVIEVRDTSVVISRIGANEEPLLIQTDMIRLCPEELVTTPVGHKTKRKQRNKKVCERKGRASTIRSHACRVRDANELVCFRANREFDVPDATHCLHGNFRCVGQKLPVLEDLPDNDLIVNCNCNAMLKVRHIIPDVPEAVRDQVVESVLEGGRVITIWQGVGSLAEKVEWIENPFRRVLTPRGIALSYAFFRSKCIHVSVLSGQCLNGVMRHPQIAGWSCDLTQIFELGWNLARKMTWKAVKDSIGKEHRRVLLLVPDVLHRLKFAAHGTKDLVVFYYKQFKEIHLRKTELFDNNIGHVICVMPPSEPRPDAWLPLVHAVNMWLRIGCRLYLVAGPRSEDANSWYRTSQSARWHVQGLLDANPELTSQVVDKLPVDSGVADPESPCFAVAILENDRMWLPERQCRLFYLYLTKQLADYANLEKLSSGKSQDVRLNVQPVPADVHAPREGMVGKRTTNRHDRQRKNRCEGRTMIRVNKGRKNRQTE